MEQYMRELVVKECAVRMPQMLVKEVNVKKNNAALKEGIEVKPRGSAMGMVVYWEDIEKDSGNHMDEAVRYVMKTAEKYANVSAPSIAHLKSWEWAKTRLYRKAINYEKNQKSLEEVAHRKYLDLAEVFYLKLDNIGKNSATMEIPNQLLDEWSVTYDDLREWAELNMEEEGFCVVDIRDLLQEEEFQEGVMHIVTNREKTLGAAAILNPSLLRSLTSDWQTDIYILPSSIHELVLVPVEEGISAEALSMVVQTVNQAVVDEVSYLSDHVYRLDRGSEVVEIC